MKKNFKIGNPGVSVPAKFVTIHKTKEAWTTYAKHADLFVGHGNQEELINEAWDKANEPDPEPVKEATTVNSADNTGSNAESTETNANTATTGGKSPKKNT